MTTMQKHSQRNNLPITHAPLHLYFFLSIIHLFSLIIDPGPGDILNLRSDKMFYSGNLLDLLVKCCNAAEYP